MYAAEVIVQEIADLLDTYFRHTVRASFKDADALLQRLSAEPIQKERSALNDALSLLVRIANGDFPGDVADDLLIGDVEEAIGLVSRILFAAPGNPRHYEIPRTFWYTDTGRVIQHCQLWLRGDDLIAYTEAARILFPDLDLQSARMRVQRMVARGELTPYADPRENNPQRAARVSRQEVENSRHDRSGER